MRLLSSLCLSLFLAAAASVSAQTINLNSYGQDNANPGYTAPTATPQNTVTTIAGGTTYDIPNGGGTWAGPLGASSWVSQNAQNFPGGSNVEPTGTYTFSTTFTTDGTVTGGTLNVLADDTTNVVLNGVQIIPAAAGVAGTHCTVGTPNCEVTYTINLDTVLGDFNTDGLNTLTFNVQQLFGSAEGLDFSGDVTETAATVTPEPSSLLLLSTGFMGMAGFFYYRRQQA